MNRLTGGAPAANSAAMDDAAAPMRLTADDEAPYRLTRAAPEVAASAIICASPHSGRIYPADMMAASQLDRRAIRRSEDAHVDELIDAAPACGHTVIAAQYARA